MSDRYDCYLELRGPDLASFDELLNPILQACKVTIDSFECSSSGARQSARYEFPQVPYSHIPDELTTLLAEHPELDVEARWIAPPDEEGSGPYVAFWMNPRKQPKKYFREGSKGFWHCACVDDDGQVLVRQCDVKRAIAGEIPWSDVLHPFNG